MASKSVRNHNSLFTITFELQIHETSILIPDINFEGFFFYYLKEGEILTLRYMVFHIFMMHYFLILNYIID